MRRLYTAAGARELDRLAIEGGQPGIELMQRAGRALFDVLLDGWPELRSVSICCGKGNNAGDGYVIAQLALEHGLAVELIQIGASQQLQGDAAMARDAALAAGVTVTGSEDGELEPDADVVVDALLGTGLSGAPRGPYAVLIERMNNCGRPIVAVDVPSGLQADTGAVNGVAIQAHTTVTFIGRKIGLHTGAGAALAGRVLVADLGVGGDVRERVDGLDWLTFDEVWSAQPLPRRDARAYKQSLGHIAVVGGDLSMGGAPLMAAEAALRSGAGMVTVITRAAHRNAILSRRPELMVVDADDDRLAGEALVKADLLIIGPGLGRSGWGDALLDRVLAQEKPMLVDADGLHLLNGWLNRQQDSVTLPMTIITPHSAEAAVLLDATPADVAADRLQAAQNLATRINGVAILKGAGTVIASSRAQEARCLGICAHGNPGMASAGMGDVLAGIVGGLFVQLLKDPSFERTEFEQAESASGLLAAERAALLGACLHSLAADRAAQRLGQASLLATDLVLEMISILAEVDVSR